MLEIKSLLLWRAMHGLKTRATNDAGYVLLGRVFAATMGAACAATAAAAPMVEFLHPAGGQQGTTISVTIGGKLPEWPVKVWADHVGIKAEVGKEKGSLSVAIDKDVPPGAHLLRLYDATGAATPAVFMVGQWREVAEAEPNDEVAKAQAAGALPVVANGRLEKSGDVDCFAVELQAGQPLVASLTGRRIGSPMDPMLHLTDSEGNQLAFAHDGYGLDPLLVYRAEKAGRYVVRVSGFAHPPAAEVRLTGDPAAVYRLSLGTELPARYALPAGVKRGTQSKVRPVRWGAPPEDAVMQHDVDATGVGAAEPALDVRLVGSDEPLRMALGEGPELVESELKSSGDLPPLSVPVAVTGWVERDGEEDAYRFAAKKGEKFVIAARSVAVASGMDAVLRVEDEAGKTLASDDDKGDGSDARVEWEAGAEGTFRAIVGDLFRRGGDAHVYRLFIAPAASGAPSAALDADAYVVAPGKPATVKLAVARAAEAGGLVAVVTGLPPGVGATSAEVPEKGGEVTITVNAAPDAKPAGAPLRVMLLGTDPKRPASWVATSSLRKENGQELVARTDAPWLTVLAAPAPEKKP
jgi:hypothetical protein